MHSTMAAFLLPLLLPLCKQGLPYVEVINLKGTLLWE